VRFSPQQWTTGRSAILQIDHGGKVSKLAASVGIRVEGTEWIYALTSCGLWWEDMY